MLQGIDKYTADGYTRGSIGSEICSPIQLTLLGTIIEMGSINPLRVTSL